MAGKRYSRQREMIYRAVVGSKEHPTAEMVYQWLKPANPNLSLGTVYRNLSLLVDLDLPYDAALDAAAAASAPELAVRCHDTVFYGLCAKCREAKR